MKLRYSFQPLISLALCCLLFSLKSNAQTIGDYRTAATGNWTSSSTWQIYTSSGWAAATSTPTYTDGVITIQSGHTVTVNSYLTLDQVVVNGGITVVNSGTIALNDGTGTDLNITSSGTLQINNGGTVSAWTSSITMTCAGTITCNNGAAFNNAATFTLAASGTYNNNNGATYSHNNALATNIYGTFNNNSGATYNSWTGGTLTISGTFNHSGSSFGSNANISILSGGVLNMNSAISMYSGTTFSNAGTVFIASGITFTQQCVTTNSGYVKCSGYFKGNGSSSATITNTGTIRFTSTGYMLNSSTFTNNSTGVIIDSSSTAPVISPNSGSSTPLIFNNSTMYNRVANGGTIPTATWNNTSTCIVSGVTTTVPAGLGQSFVNFTWNCANQAINYSLGGTFTTVSGNFTVNNTGKTGSTPYELRLSDGQALTFTVGGNITIGAKADVAFCNSGSTTGAITVSGNFIDSGYVYLSKGTGTTTLTINGNLYTYNGGYSKFTMTQNSANSTIKVLGNYRNAATFVYNDGTGGNSATGNGTLTVYGNFTQASTGSITNTSVKNADGLINLRGGSAVQYIDSSLSMSNVVYTIGKSTTVQLLTNLKLYRHAGLGTKHYSLTDSGAINLGIFSMVKNHHSTGITGDRVLILDSAKVLTAHAKGLYNDTTGSIHADTLDLSAGACITYNSTTAQSTGLLGIKNLTKIYKIYLKSTGGMDTVDIKIKVAKLYLNNSYGATLKDTLSISNCLYLQNGVLNTANALVKIDTSLTTAISGYSSTSYVNGFVRRLINTNGQYDFPTGTASNYQLASITFHDITGTKYLTSQFVTTNTGTVPSDSQISVNGTAINTLLNGGYWIISPDVEPTGGTYDVTVNEKGFNNGAGSPYQYTIIKRPTTNAHWKILGTHTNSTQSSANSTVIAARTGLTSFSQFGIGYGNNPLPVKLAEFKGENAGTTNNLVWVTASEENTDHFELEYTYNGTDFTYLSSIKAGGNSREAITYSFEHNNVTPGIYYYRLKSVDKDGSYKYSNTIFIDVKSNTASEATLNVYPNPATDNINIDLRYISSSMVNVQVSDFTGHIISAQTIANNGHATLNISNLVTGQYFIIVTNTDNNTQHNARFIKQ